MSAFYLLPGLWQSVLSVPVILLVTASMAAAAGAVYFRFGWSYVTLSVILLLGSSVLFQGIGDYMVVTYQGRKIISSLGRAVSGLPWGILLAGTVALLAAQLVLCDRMRRKRRDMLTVDAIKYTMDSMEDGICFYDSEGWMLLTNAKMNHLSGELFGTEILNGLTFWNGVTDGTLQSGRRRRRGKALYIQTEDGRVWDFRRTKHLLDGQTLYEVTAFDITGQSRLYDELEHRNAVLRQVNIRLRTYNREIEHIAREKEILAVKVRVHDDLGQLLLATRRSLAKADSDRDREELLRLWFGTVSTMRTETEAAPRQNDWALFCQAAKAVDVAVSLAGELPGEGPVRNAVMTALHECLTNTVKHAGGDCLEVAIRREKGILTARFENNGRPPEGPIRETGGLLNLRRTVEDAGGTMQTIGTPRFQLILTFAEEAEEWIKSK